MTSSRFSGYTNISTLASRRLSVHKYQCLQTPKIMENEAQTGYKHEHATRHTLLEPIRITLRTRSTLLLTAQALDTFIDLIRHLHDDGTPQETCPPWT